MRPLPRPTVLLFSAAMLLAAAGCGSGKSQALQASGLIEAETVNVAPELSGRVIEVMVEEGQSVQAGDELLRLDDELLQAQRRVSEASLATAQASLQAAQTGLDSAQIQYDLTLDVALAQESATRQREWAQTPPDEFDQPLWYFGKAERIAALQAEITDAEQFLADAQSSLEAIRLQDTSADFLRAETALAQARQRFQIAQQLRQSTVYASDGQELRDAANQEYDDAKEALDIAQQAYDEALTTQAAQDLLEARARMAIAQAEYDAARTTLRALQSGADSGEVKLAGQAVAQAQAAVEQAQATIAQAQASLDLLDLQIKKLTVRAPMDGVVLTLSVRTGAVLQAGMTALTIADLSQMTVTVYVPEDRYAEVSLGDTASLVTDSFPDETFRAVVTRIADQAEYTPRNVQTKEERQTTVYAIELSIDNPDARLKPGMPVDVTFGP
jgi:HlyD family secretion protein